MNRLFQKNKPNMSNGKNSKFFFILVFILFLFSILIAEITYRAYLYYHLNLNISGSLLERNSKNFRVLSFPALQAYNQQYGFEYFTGDIVSADIKDGILSTCGYGNYNSWSKDAINPDHLKYFDADIKILLLGSSHTATIDDNGELASVLASRNLSRKLGKSLKILNLSRGSYGFLSMVDLAIAKIEQYQPDLIIFAINTSDLARPRWWPIYVPDGNGFHLFYQSRTPFKEKMTQENSLLHQHIFNDRLTKQWCDRIKQADQSGKSETYKIDKFTQTLLKYAKGHKERQRPPNIDLNLWILSSSFLMNKILYDDPFYGEEVYKDGNPIGPIAIDDFIQDAQFVNAWEELENSAIPIYLLHIPNPFELEENVEFLGGYGGMPKHKIDRLVASIPKFYDRDVLSLLPYYGAPVSDVSQYVVSDENWHPNAYGTAIISTGLEGHLFKLLVENKIIQDPAKAK